MRGDNVFGIVKKIKRSRRDMLRLLSMKRDMEAGYSRLSYSQEGEDLIVATLLEYVRRGFFIDVGAHHPKRFSNTYLLYQRGWSGINIDPTPGCMAAFRKLRPRDINLEIGVGRESAERRFFMFQEGALNTFDAGLANQRRDAGRPFAGEYKIRTQPLRDILQEHCRQPVEFLNVDAEGYDLEVLQSNDWNTHRPRIVCVEALRGDEDEANGWLKDRGYKLVALTGRSRIYQIC